MGGGSHGLRRAGAVGFAVALCWANLAQAKIFADAFSGQGRSCGGNLYIRTKTIEWDTQFSVCQSRYTIIKKTFSEKPVDYDYILYKLDRPGRACLFRYIGLYYYDYYDTPGYADHWVVTGFPTFKDYRRFPYREVVSGRIPTVEYVLSCQLPFYGDGNGTNINY